MKVGQLERVIAHRTSITHHNKGPGTVGQRPISHLGPGLVSKEDILE